MPASLHRPSPLTGLSDRLRRLTPAGADGAPAWLPAALTLSGVAVAALVVWHFVNPAQFALDDWLAIVGGLASAAVIGVGVFQWTGQARPPRATEPVVSEEMVNEMTEQLRRGRAVSWAGPVYLLPTGIQAGGRVCPWAAIDLSRTAADRREFRIYLQDAEEPIAILPTSAARYAAGRRVFEAFSGQAAGGPVLDRVTDRRAA
jgi:hypothetical protein